MVDSTTVPENPPGPPCFMVSEVFDNCIPIYLAFNLHFFLQDDCSGTIDPGGGPLPHEDAYRIGEELVDEVNYRWANNKDQINALDWPPFVFNPAHCVPVRLVLKGIYIHCSTEWRALEYNLNTGWDVVGLNNTLGIDPNSVLNYYVTNLLPSSSGDNPTGIGFPKTGAIDWMEPGNFIHELGHTFSLSHSWLDDNSDCDDTPNINFDFDYNCNGILETIEKDKQCGEGNLSLLPVENSKADRNNNDIHDCTEIWPGCTDTIPCCFEVNQNNNIMSYGYPKEALTNCQIEKTLINLATEKCDFIEQIDGCPPPNAFVSILPTEYTDNNCTFCLHMQASYNDTRHFWQLYQIVNGQEIFKQSVPLIQQSAGKVCFLLDGQNLPFHLERNTIYRLKLTVYNECSDSDVATIDFMTPDTYCIGEGGGGPGLTSPAISPNPANGVIQVSFSLPTDGQTWIYATHLMTGEQKTIAENYPGFAGSQSLDANTSAWLQGVYSIQVFHPSGSSSALFTKL